MEEADWDDMDEIERTWQAALVRIPVDATNHIITNIHDLNKVKNSVTREFPTIIYLHGCAGVWSGTHRRMEFLANNGFAVIAPVSFARDKYPKSCDEFKHVGGFYRAMLQIRKNDAHYAITKAKQLPWVDGNNIFLMGFSQGGITTAAFDRPDLTVNARVVEGWTCHAGWNEYHGIRAPDNEPVLSLVGELDPWFQNGWNKGDCGKFMNQSNGSRSIVYQTGELQYQHALLENSAAQQTVLEFIHANLK